MIAYYNTTGLPTPELIEAIRKATIQDDRVILIYKAKNKPLTASNVWIIYKAWFQVNTPL